MRDPIRYEPSIPPPTRLYVLLLRATFPQSNPSALLHRARPHAGKGRCGDDPDAGPAVRAYDIPTNLVIYTGVTELH